MKTNNDKIYFVEDQTIVLNELPCNGFVLDIGGGGEGIIGAIYGSKTVSIDISEKELQEVNNDALKIIADGANLPFLNNTFDLGYMFFSLMYMDSNEKLAVLKEVYRTLRPGYKAIIYDLTMQPIQNKYIAIPLTIILPNGEIMKTGYGSDVQKCWQTAEAIENLVKQAGFIIVNKSTNDAVFFLELVK